MSFVTCAVSSISLGVRFPRFVVAILSCCCNLDNFADKLRGHSPKSGAIWHFVCVA